jgi:hypothetical protein
VRAIEALRDVAMEGDDDAQRALVDGLDHPDGFLRMANARALLVLRGNTARAKEQVRELLLEGDHWMVESGGAP